MTKLIFITALALATQAAKPSPPAAKPAAPAAKPAAPAAQTGVSATLPPATPEPAANEWPMWGGTPDRNMFSSMKGIPTTWDLKTKKNIKWIAELGSQTYGNTVVAGGYVLVGTNNEGPRDPNIKGDKGIVMAFRESDGQFMWQAVHDKLQAGRANDWPFQGICSSPLVENGIVYYVSNRGELMAVDLDGFRDGQNDGPVKDEKLTREVDADVLWKFDMMDELGVMQHNMANSSPVAYGDLIFISTSNGQDESHVNVPAPKAPAIIAVNKKTGKLAWEDNSVGERILHGQWSSPAVGKVGDVMQVAVGQGDGWVRGYEALSGKKLWEFDLNPKDSVWPKTRNEVISTPVFIGDVVYIANGQDPEHGEGVGHLYAIDATKRGDITKSGLLWHYGDIRRSISTGAYYNGILFYSDFSGFLHALDAKTGKPYWKHDMFAAIWGSPIVIDGKVFLGDEDGDVTILNADKTLKVVAEHNMGSSVYSTVTPANGTIYIVNRNQLVAIAEAK
jgi:outer membrane protein assembly factor BamB